MEALNQDELLATTRSDLVGVKVWGIRFALEDRKPSAKILARLKEMAVNEKSAKVRKNLASGLQRKIPLEQRHGPLPRRSSSTRRTPRTRT